MKGKGRNAFFQDRGPRTKGRTVDTSKVPCARPDLFHSHQINRGVRLKSPKNAGWPKLIC